MNHVTLSLAVVLGTCGVAATAHGDILGSARDFAVLGGSAVTNTGTTVLNGDLGVWPGLALSGFGSATINGAVHAGDGVAMQAQLDVGSGYDALAGMSPTLDLTGLDLGGMVLTPGVYFFSSSAFLTGSLVLDAMGDPDALFVFQTGSTLITASNSSVVTINGADGCDIYWQVGSSATLGTETAFQGNILALASITLNTGATMIEGRALARTGAVTLDANTITAGCIPAPGAVAVFGAFAFGAMGVRRR